MSQATFRLLASTTHLGSVKSQDTCHIPNFQGTPCWLQRQTVSKVCALSTRCWWSQPGSNRRPPACKAGALPAELWPHRGVRSAAARMVGLGGLEPPASPLSGVRSNHLSYRPNSRSMPCTAILAVSDACAWIQVPCVGVLQGRSCSKGGDPAAPSDTATLLRLHPSH